MSFKTTSKNEYRILMDTKKKLGDIFNFINAVEKKVNNEN